MTRHCILARWRHDRHGRPRGIPRRVTPLVAAPALALLLMLAALLPFGPSRALLPVASAHALPVRSDPASGAILQAPPSSVRIWFSEAVNPLTSKIVVVDPANREVDNGDSHVSDDNPNEMIVGLPLLPAGTYVVFWRTQSADDGHVTAGTYLFRIARPDGTVPPVPPVLPTGNFPGAGGVATGGNATLDAPTVLQGLGTWLALLAMTFWVGGLIWETWILPAAGQPDADLRAAARAAARRFRAAASTALAVVLVADVLMILGQSAALAGSLAGAFSPPLLRAILFGSRFGAFWWMRELVAAAALALYLVADQRRWSRAKAAAAPGGESAHLDAPTTSAIPDWRREVLATLRGIGHLPARLVAGWRGLTWFGRAECVLGLALIVAFALSGHAAAVPAGQFIPAIAVDLLHLLAEAAWLGGLFYIALALVPALAELRPRQAARVLALGLPLFGAVAILAAVLLAATGSLNTAIRLTSIEQFLTTTYGRTLAIKIELFLIMLGISAYHAFYLRPRLAAALSSQPAAVASARATEPEQARETLVTAGASSSAPAPRSVGRADPEDTPSVVAPDAADSGMHGGGSDGGEPPLTPRARSLEERLRDWLRREALLGGAVLLCVALLGIFAGSLTPPAAPAPAGSSGQPAPYVSKPEQAGSYVVTLSVSPDRFGTNTFTVLVTDAQGKPVSSVSVILAETMLDMDMGTQSLQLHPDPNKPGAYTGQGDLTMAGHWRVVVKILPPNNQPPQQASFEFSATY